MTDEISDAVSGQLEDAALVLMRQKHRHNDGSDVVLQPIHSSGDSDSIEQRLFEAEQRWKDKTAMPEQPEEQQQPRQEKQEQAPEPWQPAERKKQVIIAGCNCGQILSAEFKDKENPLGGGISLKGYDAQGATTLSYGVSGSSGETYSVQGDTDKEYA
jgi:hypothetical protein